MQSYAPLRLALLACVAALTPTTVDRRSAMKLPLAVVALAPGAARADDVIVSGTVNAAKAAVWPEGSDGIGALTSDEEASDSLPDPPKAPKAAFTCAAGAG